MSVELPIRRRFPRFGATGWRKLDRPNRHEGGGKGARYVSANRTQIIFAVFSMYQSYLQKLIAIEVAFSNWVRFPKRTQFKGSMRGCLPENGVVSGQITSPGAVAMGCAAVGMRGVRWLFEWVLVSWETLRFAQSDRLGEQIGRAHV